jgi:hypothetical protein
LAAVVLSFFGRPLEAFFGEFFSKGFEGFPSFDGFEVSESVTTHYTKPDGTTGTRTRTVLKLGKPADGHHERTKCKFGIDCREIRAGRRCSYFHTKEELAAARQYVANAKAAAVAAAAKPEPAAAKPDAAKTKLAPKPKLAPIEVFAGWLKATSKARKEKEADDLNSSIFAFVEDLSVDEDVRKYVIAMLNGEKPEAELVSFCDRFEVEKQQ